jgi:oxygen-independent coproporphyrinogen-3 oxidase
MSNLRDNFRQQLAGCAYPGYVYGYPHKKAYRPLDPTWSRANAWAQEDRRHLFAYVHVPFCEQRCSFCNLFTYVPGKQDPTSRYLDSLALEMQEQARVLGKFSFSRLYLGGGTPTFLTAAQLHRLFRDLRETLGVDPQQTHGCIEASPETLDEDKLGVLREVGIQRLSLGVQSFVPEELQAINRRFDYSLHERAIEQIALCGFPEFNIDLIYGLPGQTRDTWFRSLERALASSATSLFLYPLYIRPLTGLDRRADRPPGPTQQEMHAWYDETLSRLREAGFQQLSMRQFHRGPLVLPGDDYRCQSDAMVGLGAGARSYTRLLHYSTPWRMTTRNIRSVIDDYCQAMQGGDFTIRHGFVLNPEERLRRWVVQSLLAGVLDKEECRKEFGQVALESMQSLFEILVGEDCARPTPPGLRLTPRGVRHSDIVGQLFFSEQVRQLIAEFEYDP